MSFYTYSSNIDSRIKTGAIEFDRSDGTRGRLEIGKALDLTPDEFNRLSQYIVLTPGGTSGSTEHLRAPVYTDPTTGKIDPSLLPVATGVGRPSLAQRRRLVNGFKNPVAANAAPLSYVNLFAVAGATLGSMTTDGPHPDVQSCFQITSTNLTGFPTLDWGTVVNGNVAADGSVVNNNTGLLGYVACRVKGVALPANSAVNLSVLNLDANRVVIGAATIVALRHDFEITDWTLMEGFVWLPNTVRNLGARFQIVGGSAGPNTDVRISDLTLIVDPTGPVFDTPVGSRLGHSWAGTAHDSASVAFPSSSMAGKPHGFNELTPYLSRGPNPSSTVTDDELIALTAESGADSMRNVGAIVTVATYGSLPWTDRTQAINFDNWWFDAVAKKIRAAGLKWLPIAGGTMPWMPIGAQAAYVDSAVAAQNVADSVAFWTALVKHYQDIIVGVEWLNEPNLHGFWGPAPSGASYMNLLRQFYLSMKATVPAIPVISCGISPVVTTGSGDVPYTTFIADCYANGLKDNCDAVGLHAYPATIGSGTGSDVSFPDGYDKAIYNVHKTMNDNGDGAKKIWLTELGMQTNHASGTLTGNSTERQQMQTLALLASLAQHDTRIGAFYVHQMIASTTTDRFQVVQAPQLRRRRAFYALQEAFGVVRTHTWSRWRVPGDTGEATTLGTNWSRFQNSGEPLMFRENGESVQLRGTSKKSVAGVGGETIVALPVGANGDADLSPSTVRYRDANATGDVEGRTTINEVGIVQWNTGDPTGFFMLDAEFSLEDR